MDRFREPREFLKRRWKVVATLSLLEVGTVLLLLLLDGGHDPHAIVFSREGSFIEVSPSLDGRFLWALVRVGDRIDRIEAFDRSGRFLWSAPLSTTYSTLHSWSPSGFPPEVPPPPSWVAVTTAFPEASVLVLEAESGRTLRREPIPGNPVALAGEGGMLLVSYQAPGNPLLFLDLVSGNTTTLPFPGLVRTLFWAHGTWGAGTLEGHLLAGRASRVLLNTTLPFSIRSLRLDSQGRILAVGGFSLEEGDLSGAVEVFDVETGRRLWRSTTPHGVSFVDLSRDGKVLLVLEELPGRFVADVLEAPTGRPLLTRQVESAISHTDDGSNSGASLSPDGSFVALAPLLGPIVVVNVLDPSWEWEYAVEGSMSSAFAGNDPTLLAVSSRLVPERSYDALLLFSPTDEPPFFDPSSSIPSALLLESALGALLLVALFEVERARSAPPSSRSV